MSVPGSNLLALALTVITPQQVRHFVNLGSTTNGVGKKVSSFADPVDVAGSFQPVNMAAVQMYGLDVSKEWAIFYASTPVAIVAREVGGDELTYAGKRYHCWSNVGWFAQDGWNSTLCVMIGPDA